MARIIVSYDLSDGWTEVADLAFAHGFYNILESTIGPKQAPNTVIFFDSSRPSAVYDLFIAIVKLAALNLGRPIIARKVFCAAVSQEGVIQSDLPAR